MLMVPAAFDYLATLTVGPGFLLHDQSATFPKRDCIGRLEFSSVPFPVLVKDQFRTLAPVTVED